MLGTRVGTLAEVVFVVWGTCACMGHISVCVWQQPFTCWSSTSTGACSRTRCTLEDSFWTSVISGPPLDGCGMGEHSVRVGDCG